MGSSNADRSATALREEGNFVNTIKVSHWKPKPEAVAALTDHVREALRVGQTRVLVFQLFDNLLYLGRQPDGTTSHAVRDPDGRYHVVGNLVVAGKEAQYNIFKSMKPALLHLCDTYAKVHFPWLLRRSYTPLQQGETGVRGGAAGEPG